MSGESSSYEGDVGVAFGLVVMAGLCSPLGACVVLFVKVCNKKLLAASLGLASGEGQAQRARLNAAASRSACTVACCNGSRCYWMRLDFELW
jgi:hypothetical protein